MSKKNQNTPPDGGSSNEPTETDPVDPSSNNEPTDPPKEPTNTPDPEPSDDDSNTSVSATEFKRLQADARKKEKELEKLRQEKKEREDAELSEMERTKKQLQEAQDAFEAQAKRNLQLRKEQALQRAAAELGVKRQSAILKLVDWDSIEVDDDDQIVGASEALEAVKTDVPELFPSDDNTPPSTSTPGTGGGKTPDKNPTDEGFDSEYELGQAIYKSVTSKKNKAKL